MKKTHATDHLTPGAPGERWRDLGTPDTAYYRLDAAGGFDVIGRIQHREQIERICEALRLRLEQEYDLGQYRKIRRARVNVKKNTAASAAGEQPGLVFRSEHGPARGMPVPIPAAHTPKPSLTEALSKIPTLGQKSKRRKSRQKQKPEPKNRDAS